MTEAKIAKVYFYGNGNTMVFIDNEQSAEHQKSWLLKFVEFLEKNNIDVENSEFNLPDRRKAKLFRIENGYNWRIEE